MTMEEVLAFVHRILACAQDEDQAQMMLAQFEQILSRRAMEDESMREAEKIVRQARSACPESKEIAHGKDRLTLEDIKIAQQRCLERLAREMAMNRC